MTGAAPMASSGADILLDILESEGVSRVFGNPGTTELPLVEALAGRPSPEYVLALQEATAVGMADGYAQAVRSPSFVSLHSLAGLANGLANIANAAANGTPIVVTAGQQDTRHLIAEPLLSGDLVGLARPICKWAHEVRSLRELPVALRRAFRLAVAPPAGPVFLSLPMDVLDEVGEVELPPRSRVELAATGAALDELAELLASAERLLIVVGDEVARADGVTAAVELAEAIGAEVAGAPLYGAVNFPSEHPLWRGALPHDAAAIARFLEPFDRVLALGAPVFLTYNYTNGAAVPESVELLQVHPNPAELGKTYAARLAVLGDPAVCARALAAACRDRLDGGVREERLRRVTEQRNETVRRFDETARSRYDRIPMAPMAAAHALSAALPAGGIVVDESVTLGPYVRGYHRTRGPGTYFFNRGAGLGWGMPAAVGVQLADFDRSVLAIVGDGSALYAPQALWTAAHYDLPVVFAIVNNNEYRILKHAVDARGHPGAYVGLDLAQPAVDFGALAGSLGVRAERVESAHDVVDAVRAAFAARRPCVLELPIESHGA